MHSSVRKFLAAANLRGLSIEIVETSTTTRTAQEAADTIGCQVAQIVKSLCFEVNGGHVMVLMSGINQLDLAKLAALSGVGKGKVRRPDASAVKSATGYTIGGVPPFGYDAELPVYIDQDLFAYQVVWAAAGTPHAVFAVQPADLAAASGGTAADLKR